MMRILKNPDSMWVEMPRSVASEITGNKLFVDFGNGVYAAFQPFGATGLDTVRVSQDLLQIRYRWKFNTSIPLGALALETGTSANFASYSDFKTQTTSSSTLTSQDANTITYSGANGHTLKMEFQTAAQPYVMITPVVPACTLTTAGTTPKVWGNGNYINFESWNSYQTTFGKEVVYQPWGGGFMDLRSADQGLQIRIDSANAAVTYQTFDPEEYVTGVKQEQNTDSNLFQLIPNPAKGEVRIFIQEKVIGLEIRDVTGRRMEIKTKIQDGQNSGSLKVDINQLTPGMYQVLVQTKSGRKVKRLVVE
jgi:hypothetical protein